LTLLKKTKSLYLLFCLALQLNTANAQLLKWKKFSLTEGLPHPTVFRFLQQDTTGIIWLGTDYGLSRYDGYEFINFTYNSPVSLNAVLGIVALNKDSLLLSYYREGPYIFSNGKLFPVKIKKGIEKHDNLVQFAKGNNSVYTVGTSGNVFQYKNGVLQQLLLKSNGKNLYPTCIAYSSQLGLLLGTANGLYYYKNNILKKYDVSNFERRIDFIQADNNGSVWIASNDKVFKITNNTLSTVWDIGKNCQHSLIYVDYRGYIWRASPQQGLLVKRGDNITNVSKLLGIENDIINCIEEDWEGNLWIGTRTNGVYCISISEYIKTFSLKNNKKTKFVSAVLSTENYDWIASQNKLYKAKNMQLEEIKHPFFEEIPAIYSLFKDRNGRVLTSTPLGLFIYDEKSNTTSVIKNPMNGTIDFTYTRENKLIVSSFKGLFSLEKNQLIPYANGTFIENRFNTLLTDYKGTMWLGGENGLYKSEKEKVTPIITNVKIFHLLLAKDSSVWAATNKGLFKFKNSQEKHYTISQGLSHNICNALVQDNEGKIWVGTLKGLCYNENSDVFFPYDIQPFEEMNEILSLSILNDNLLVGTVDEAYKLKLKIPTCNPGMVISKLLVGDSIYYSPIPFTLPYKSNSLSIYYSSVAVAYAQQLRYETKLHPIDTGWNVTTNNFTNFKNLPPGKYTFSVRVKNHANGEVSRIQSINFSVHTPFWQKWWFLALVALLLIAIALLIHRIRLNNLRQRDLKKNEYEKQLLYLKMQAMNALMNPHFISNVLHAIISYLENLKPGEVVNDKYITYFSELIRLNLINSDKSYITLKDELRRIELYILLEQFRFKNRFDFAIELDPTIDKANIEIPNMIVQPFIENAINHGLLPSKNKGTLLIKINAISHDLIKIIIEDNGIGINNINTQTKPVLHRSMGIKLVKERMLSSQQPHPIQIEDLGAENKQGTKVTIVLEV
jgi:ligand-binding sensor domain-containing protein